jgi:hypothetical protein
VDLNGPQLPCDDTPDACQPRPVPQLDGAEESSDNGKDAQQSTPASTSPASDKGPNNGQPSGARREPGGEGGSSPHAWGTGGHGGSKGPRAQRPGRVSGERAGTMGPDLAGDAEGLSSSYGSGNENLVGWWPWVVRGLHAGRNLIFRRGAARGAAAAGAAAPVVDRVVRASGGSIRQAIMEINRAGLSQVHLDSAKCTQYK